MRQFFAIFITGIVSASPCPRLRLPFHNATRCAFCMLWEKMKLLLLFLCAHRMHTTKATATNRNENNLSCIVLLGQRRQGKRPTQDKNAQVNKSKLGITRIRHAVHSLAEICLAAHWACLSFGCSCSFNTLPYTTTAQGRVNEGCRVGRANNKCFL